MNFREFYFAYHNGTLIEDAAWRAYDFPASVKARHVRSALKALKLQYAGELAVPQAMALYGIGNRDAATMLLGSWWLWSQVDAGRPLTGLVRRPGEAERGRALGG